LPEWIWKRKSLAELQGFFCSVWMFDLIELIAMTENLPEYSKGSNLTFEIFFLKFKKL